MLMPVMVVMVMMFGFFNSMNDHFGLVTDLLAVPPAVVFPTGPRVGRGAAVAVSVMPAVRNMVIARAGFFPGG